MRALKFSQNWNSKMFMNIFTTIRPYSKNSPTIGELIEVELKEKKYMCEVVDVSIFQLDKIPTPLWMVDTGYSKAEALKIFENFYRSTIGDLRRVNWAVISIKQRPDLQYEENN